MSILIDRQRAIDALERGKDKSAKGDIGGFYNRIIQKDIDRIKQLPSAEPQIIRCKDCAKREICRTSTVWAVAPSDDWFCADAERRTDE